ncbi:hypothetical protein HMPREF1548_05700 [Clostridium sp. KLE 1755]|nr:hypothetical protein HMPREF1548_05700 [Clostridium sp. KLE 1755]
MVTKVTMKGVKGQAPANGSLKVNRVSLINLISPRKLRYNTHIGRTRGASAVA